MKLINKKTGHSFKLNPKESAKFFYAKNANGEYINSKNNYRIAQEDDISNWQVYLLTFIMIVLFIASFLSYIQWNY